AVYPGATEICNGIDDNCDGQIDEGVKITFYQDADGDGYGNPAVTTLACSAPSGYVANDTDCDDANAAVHPGAVEICNGIDDNCNGQIDEGVKITFYQDADGDGYGNAAVTTLACSAPSGYVANNTDCDDANAAVHPGAVEICNGIDDNCNGQIDEGVKTTFYRDADGDGYGNAAVTTLACSAPAGYVTNNTDCNDNNASVYPGATEVCGNNIDDNCNGQIDENCCTGSVNAGTDINLFYGYPPTQCASRTAVITGGTGPYTYSWTINRPLLSGETITGVNSATVTVCLRANANLCVTVTGASGCQYSDCAAVNVQDIRCSSGNGNHVKVNICHNGHTICVSQNAVAAHLAHGDYLGQCKCYGNYSKGSVSTEEAEPGLSIYPNPSSGNFTVRLSMPDEDAAGATLQIININGQVIQKLNFNSQRSLAVSLKDAGIYTLQLVTKKQVISKKIMVIH
ncbi:MAG: T9SS type A sorting domain-containing protein, partial [Chitinophagaceae bacterium]|nr:T9SS type A sorting domain-containing protein [Chitinophagaceae bacterium]